MARRVILFDTNFFILGFEDAPVRFSQVAEEIKRRGWYPATTTTIINELRREYLKKSIRAALTVISTPIRDALELRDEILAAWGKAPKSPQDLSLVHAAAKYPVATIVTNDKLLEETVNYFLAKNQLEYRDEGKKLLLLKEVEVRNYKTLRHARLDNLETLNIIIGPNNCGKTSLLKTINLLLDLSVGRGEFICNKCKDNRPEKAYTIGISPKKEDSYLAKRRIELTFSFVESTVAEVVGTHGMQEWKKQLSEAVGDDHCDFLKVILKQPSEKGITYPLCSEHLSIFARNDFLDDLKNTILYCPERRLSSYKEGDNIKEFVKTRSRQEGLSSGEVRRILEKINTIVGSKIFDYDTFSWDLVEGKERYKTMIENQWSGVRSLICLMFDALLKKKKGRLNLLLIDELELGMNQASIRNFLTFIRNELKDTQVFLATHNPTLVNPLLWERENTSVYLYSVTDEKFVKINLEENKTDPNTFGGYLPHTTSLKDIHFYVEGTHDVYIYHTWFNRWIQERIKKKKDRKKLLNRVGFYHLAGNNWRHTLYTVTGNPYTSIIILDGDKRREAKEVLKKYEKNKLENLPSFRFCRSLSELYQTMKENRIPVYCIKADKIEDLFDRDFKNKEEAVEAADEVEMTKFQEVIGIFGAILDLVRD